MKITSSIWRNQNILAKDNERYAKWIRESIWIKRKGGTNFKRTLMNADEGAYQLSHLNDQLTNRTPSDDVTKTRSDQRSQQFEKASCQDAKTSLLKIGSVDFCKRTFNLLDTGHISEFAICPVVRHGNVNSIQNPSTVTNPTMGPYCILLLYTLPCFTTWQIANSQLCRKKTSL